MTIDNQVRNEKLQYAINREAVKNQPYHQKKLLSMNILQVKKYCLSLKNN